MASKKPLLFIVLIGVVAGAIYLTMRDTEPASDDIVLYGNVDLRQVALAFSGSERIAQIHVQEGDRVSEGQVLAVLESTMLNLRMQQAQAQVRVQEQSVNRLLSGSRPQEIAQAQAAVLAAQAEVTQAQQQLQRVSNISTQSDGRAVSQVDVEAAQARLAVAEARLHSAEQTHELSVLGPASEDIARAQAVLEAARAELAVLEQQLLDTELRAPIDAVVRSRLLEPGDMASPQRPVLTLAITDPKWVRAYISEVQLGHVSAGQPASISTDSHPEQPLTGRVGYIASVAEFTPKSVQTEDLRTSLVYEIRIQVDDSGNRLRLGMPATVRLHDAGTGAGL